MANVAVVGGSEEIRMLLKGLLRLHHHRIVAEGASTVQLKSIPDTADPLVLVLDVDLDKAEWHSAVTELLGQRPNVRAVLLTPSRSPRVEALAREVGVAATLRRPFAVHELVEAVEGRAPSGGPAAQDVPPSGSIVPPSP